MSNNDGGPAFPGKICIGHVQEQSGEVPIYEHPRGMTLRDYFAAKAMAAILSTSTYSRDGDPCDMLSAESINRGRVPINDYGDVSNYDMALRWVPTTAYSIADAMLRARGATS